MHILLTGGAGFIGSHVAELLLSCGHRITILDDFSSGLRSNVPQHRLVTVVEADLLCYCSAEWPRDLDAIVHFAALPSVSDSWGQLRKLHEINLSGTVHALEAARDNHVRRFIFASSAAVYGDASRVPVREKDHTEPLSPYGLQKLTAEQYGRMIARQSGMTFLALRFFNAYGPRQVSSSPYSGVVSRFIEKMRAGEAITIRGDGSQRRDFVYVKDVASAVVAALNKDMSAKDALICNIGSGTGTSVLELVETLQQLQPNWRRQIKFEQLLPGEVLVSVADLAKSIATLSFCPKWTLRTGLAEMLSQGDN